MGHDARRRLAARRSARRREPILSARHAAGGGPLRDAGDRLVMTVPRETRRTAAVRTFLIGDIRGYTRFTAEHGDEAASRLAATFAQVAQEAVEARGARVVGL